MCSDMNLIVCQTLYKYCIYISMFQTYAGGQFGWF